MTEPRTPRTEALREELAALEHEQWAAWAMTLLATENISPERRARWQPLINAGYDDLTEEMKDHDREWADRVLAAVRAAAPEAGALRDAAWEVVDATDALDEFEVNHEEWQTAARAPFAGRLSLAIDALRAALAKPEPEAGALRDALGAAEEPWVSDDEFREGIIQGFIQGIRIEAPLDVDVRGVIHCINQCGPDGSLDDCKAMGLRHDEWCDACLVLERLGAKGGN